MQKGPADAVGKDGEEEGAAESGDEADPELAAALDGGVDDITPLRLWDFIMKKYKVKQACEEEIARLGATTSQDERLRLEQERAVAIAAAVQAMNKLMNAECSKSCRPSQIGKVSHAPD